jgi:peptidoglycan/LPS O-acetylase OafA/YrhL
MPTYIRSLDGLRAIAVTLVMLFHFQLLPIGWMGVQVFFVLSGYLITRILLAEKQYSLGYYLKRFYWRRTIRIFPIYFTYLLLIALAFLVMGTPETGQGKLPYLFTYTYNYTRILPDWSHSPLFTHLWSLSVEEQFYLVWPILLFIMPSNVLRWFIPLVVLAGPIIRYFTGEWFLTLTEDTEAAGEAIYWFTLSHFDAFAIGGAITLFQLPKKLPKAGMAFGLSLIIAIVIGLVNWQSLVSQGYELSIQTLGYAIAVVANYQHVWSYTVLNICFALMIIALIQLSDLKKWSLLALFNTRFLVSVGKVSYGMYLFHWALMAVFYKIASPFVGKGWIAFVPYFLMVYVVAWLSFHYYESLFLKLKDRFYVKPEQITAP